MNRKMQGKRLTTMLAAGLLTMAAASSAYAYPGSGLIAEWDTSGLPTNAPSLTGNGAEHISAVELTRGPGLSGYQVSGSTNYMNTTGWNGTTDTGDYFQFTLTVDSGFEANLNEFWISTKASNTGPGTIGFYSSFDNYVTPFFTVSGNGYNDNIINLSSLTSTTKITGSFFIRLYEIGDTQADGSGATAGTGTFRVGDYYDGAIFHNIGISGTVAPVSAVPVPAAAWLLGTGLLGLVGLKRKRQ